MQNRFFTVLTYDSIRILIGAVYLPLNITLPTVQSHVSSIEELISSSTPTHFLLYGDFNIPKVSWSYDSLGPYDHGQFTPLSSLTVHSFSYLNLFHLNHVRNSHGSLWTLFFCSTNNASTSVASSSIVCFDTYHPPLSITFRLTSMTKRITY